MTSILPGRYRHYKGNEYTVLGVARHSEMHEEMVVYQPEYGERGLWVRPAAMFLESVHVNGKTVPRFEFLGSADAIVERGNLFAAVPANLPAEIVETLVGASHVRIERIVSQGHASPADFWYDQAQHEWVALLAGAARLRFEGDEPIEMKPGDWIHIPAHRKHQVVWTTPNEPTIWLAVHYQPR